MTPEEFPEPDEMPTDEPKHKGLLAPRPPGQGSTILGSLLLQGFVYAMLGVLTYAMLFRELALEEFEKQWLIGFGSVLLTLLNLMAGYHLGKSTKEE